MIAALYVQRGGVYWDVEGVDPWDEQRDARLYAGPAVLPRHLCAATPPAFRDLLLSIARSAVGVAKGRARA